MAVGTGLAVAGLATTAATTGLSFYQASKQRKLKQEAEAKAAAAMVEARKKLDSNFYKSIGINKEPYELERDAVLSTAAQNIQAGVESERGAASVAGRVQMAMNKGQREIAGAMGEEIQNLNLLAAREDSRLNTAKANLDLQTAEGAQLAARSAEFLQNQALTQGFEGVTSFAGQAAGLAPLYPNKKMKTPAVTPQTLTSAPDETAEYVEQLSDADYFNSFANGTLSPEYIRNGEPIPYEEYLQLMSGQKYPLQPAATPYNYVNPFSIY